MPKREYVIDEKPFHVEPFDKAWRGWFIDDPSMIYRGNLKRDVLEAVGYQPEGILYRVSDEGIEIRGTARTMQTAYEKFRSRLTAGHRPKFRADKRLSKFMIWARDECRCIYCGIEPELSAQAHIDHIVPVGAGGESIAGNLAVACASCNSSKGNRRLHDEQGFLDRVGSRNIEWGIRDNHVVDVPDRTPFEFLQDD